MENDKQIKVELYPEVAPNTVANFISLINDKFYDGLIFHRVIPEFMIQGETLTEMEQAVQAIRLKESSVQMVLKTA